MLQDQIALLKSSFMELNVLRLAFRLEQLIVTISMTTVTHFDTTVIAIIVTLFTCKHLYK